jgi:uncharacterized protein YkwD
MLSTITKRLALIAAIPATLLGLVMVSAVMVSAPASAAPVSVTTLQADVVTLTNQQRAAHGCKALKVDARLTTAARGHSTYMAKTGAFSHTGSSRSSFAYRIKAAGYPQPAAENIAFGYRSGAEVVKAWMASPAHRTNILNCKATTVGVGAVYAASGNPYFTQDFGY